MYWTAVTYTILIGFISCLLYKLVNMIRDYFRVRSFPGPPIESFLYGNTISSQESTDNLTQTLEFRKKWIHNYPKLCRFAIGPFMQVMCAHPDSVRTVINDNFPKYPGYSVIRDWIGDGLLTSKGEKWFRHRKLLTPAFHYEILNEFFPVYSNCVDEMLELWSTQLANTGHVVLQDWMSYLTLDILLQCICSVKTDCQVKREELQYVKDIATLTRIVQLRFRKPLKYYYNITFNFTELGREFKEICSRTRKFSHDIIITRRQQLEGRDRNAKYRDFLDILLHATDPKTGATLTDEEIRDEVDTFVFEGHDTTATALTWTLYLLAKHTEYQEICRQEVFEILGGNPTITKSVISSLKFLPMCIKESLRMYPPVSLFLRCPAKQTNVVGYSLPAGLFTIVSIFQMQNCAKIWDNPSQFDPYRFSKENIDKIDPFSYIPFSAGPRNCIGQNMAMHELNYVIARILTRFHLTLPKDFPEEMEYELNILLKPKIPFKINLSPI